MHSRPGIAPACLGALLLAGAPLSLRAQDSATIAPHAGTPAWSVGASRVVIDSAEIATAAASTLTELLQARAASVSVLMTGGTLRESGQVRMRGISSVGTDAIPILVVDGVRVASDQEEAFGSASRLDDIALADIARIEILRGPAATTLFGGGAAPGAILVTTKRGDGAMRWRVRGAANVRSDPTSYPTNYHRTGTDAITGQPTNDCSLVRVGIGQCTPTGLEQWNPLEATNPFRAGAELGAGTEASGRAFDTALRLSIDSRHAEGITRDDEASRLGARLSASRSFGPVDVQLTGGVSREWTVPSRAAGAMFTGYVGPASPDSIDAFRQRIDALLGANVPHDRLEHPTVGVGLRWRALGWLTAGVGLGSDRVDARAEQSYLGLNDAPVHFLGTESRTRRTADASLETRHALPFGAAGVARLGAEYQRRESGQRQQTDVGGLGPVSQSSYSLVKALGWYGEERATWGERAALGVGARYERDEGVSRDWHFHPAVDGTYLVVRDWRGATIRARAAYGEVAQLAPPEIFFPVFPPGPAINRAIERVRETEAGIDATWGARGAISLTAYESVVRDAYLYFPATPSPIWSSERLRMWNRGLEADARMRVVSWARGGWDLRTIVATVSNRVKMKLPSYIVNDAMVRDGVWAFAPADRGFTWSDADGDGIVDRSEVVGGGVTIADGAPVPTLEAALHSGVTLGDRLTLSIVLDRRSGLHARSAERFRCGFPAVCRERQDPATPLDEQALAVAQAFHGAGWMEDASFTRLRELSLRWRMPSRVIALLGAGDASVMLGARNVALWSRSSGLDPETNGNARYAVIRNPAFAMPLPRQVMLRLDVGYGAR